MSEQSMRVTKILRDIANCIAQFCEDDDNPGFTTDTVVSRMKERIDLLIPPAGVSDSSARDLISRVECGINTVQSANSDLNKLPDFDDLRGYVGDLEDGINKIEHARQNINDYYTSIDVYNTVSSLDNLQSDMVDFKNDLHRWLTGEEA